MDYKKLSRIADSSIKMHRVQDSASTSRKVTSILKRLGVKYYWDADRRCYRLEGPIPNLKEVLNKIESQLPENASLLRESCDIQIWDSSKPKVKDSQEITEDWVKDVYAKLSPAQIMELVDEVTDFHGDLFEVSEPTVWFLQGNGLGDVTEVKLSEIVNYLKENAYDEETTEGINTVEDALDWLETYTDGYDTAYEPGVYWVSDDAEFSAMPVETIADLCELNPEYFTLNVSDDIVKGWYEQAKSKGDGALIRGIEWNYRSEDWTD